ncbi:MAG: helix-hairpin-helix domain-containing protein [Methanothrix sp.]|uniref:radical SAM protein n=1 Tax=Methanothrix sp. TaxID=90426 RepID=UPI0025EE2E3E|nr:radical SAM protein [Methanothrix sp.]MCQ8904070.1 helix-hairpin-helix domain-containing protein [Methanothrix sp.]
MDRLVLAQGASFDLEDTDLKAEALSRGMGYDRCCYRRNDDGSTIYSAWGRNGCRISLFRTLFTNVCYHQCGYCQNAGRASNGCSYTPEELSDLVLRLRREGRIDGLFLSSGAGRDEDSTMEGMIETVRILRVRHGFPGYIHLKILPGTSRALIEEAVELSDRVSINIEAPSGDVMEDLSPTKDYERDILDRQRWIRDLLARRSSGSQTTQLVVGAAGETDLEIFEGVVREYREIGVSRVYYSAFVPIKGTIFEGRMQQPRWRESRLYQLDWLYRVYGLSPDEIKNAFDDDGFLPNEDPKVTLARESLDWPVDVNEADLQSLIRVPGIGPESARRIISYRRIKKVERPSDLIRLGIKRKAIPYLRINGWVQRRLF